MIDLLSGTFCANPNYYDHLDYFNLGYMNRFSYTCGGGQQIHIDATGKYNIEPIDDNKFLLTISDILVYSEETEDFTIECPLVRTAVAILEVGEYTFEMPYNAGKKSFTKRIYFQDNPFPHLPYIEPEDFPEIPESKQFEDYYYGN